MGIILGVIVVLLFALALRVSSSLCKWGGL